jgi:hypothetical protein
MDERQRAHVNYFFERGDYWRRLVRDETTAKMLAARDADHAHPRRTEEKGSAVFDYPAGSSRSSPRRRPARTDPQGIEAREG